MAGCDGQKIDLNPFDKDGDDVRCRWAASTEAGGAYTDQDLYSSLTLDTDNCIGKFLSSKWFYRMAHTVWATLSVRFLTNQ